MGTVITINMNEMKSSDKMCIETADFCVAFRQYMDEKNISTNELAMRTGISVRTIRRYRDDRTKAKYDIKTLVALCVGLNLYIKRSLHLINLAGLSLRPTDEQMMYYDFLNYTYCSDITVEKCNDYLIEAGFEPLVSFASAFCI